jgi:lactate racemase
VTWSFPYPWAGAIDTDALAPCRLYRLPAADEEGRPRPDLGACLRSPIGSPALAELIRAAGARSALILVDDLTRPTPQSIMLPAVLDHLGDAGIAPEKTTVLVATGLHRPMRASEIAERFGPRVTERVRVVCHDASDRESLVDIGTSSDGAPVRVNRLVREHDFVIAVGCIEPHRIAGFSGGAKMVQPGICGEEVTAAIHWRGWRTEGEALYGVVENPIRAEMEDIGDRAGLRFIVNVVLSPRGKPLAYFCGNPRAAFRAGCRESLRHCAIQVQRPDIAIVDSWPFDIDLWQACKAVSVAELVVKTGGTIILVTPCPEGLSRHAEQIVQVGYLRASEIERRVDEGSIPSLAVACHLMALGRIIERGELIVVSPGLGPALCARAGLTHAASVVDAVRRARSRLGKDADIGILANPCTMVPSERKET